MLAVQKLFSTNGQPHVVLVEVKSGNCHRNVRVNYVLPTGPLIVTDSLYCSRDWGEVYIKINAFLKKYTLHC